MLEITVEEAIEILKFQMSYYCDLKGCEEQQAFAMAIKALKQELTLEKIRAEIEQIADEEQKDDEKWAIGLRYAVKIIDKYMA